MKIAKTILLWLLVVSNTFAQVVEIPDPNLREAIRDALELPVGEPITQQEMLKLTLLHAGGKEIVNPTGLEYATNLWNLSLIDNQIEDITPLATLTNLTYLNLAVNHIVNLQPLEGLVQLHTLDLFYNRVQDLTPLANLKALRVLNLALNQVTDISPLANLSNLEKLYIQENLVDDFTSLQGLNLIEFEYDEVCDLAPQLPPVTERIENRSFPSVFAAWGGIGWSPVVNRDDLSDEEQLSLHDLHWHPSFSYSINWNLTATEPAIELATSLSGDLSRAVEIRQQRLKQNPNLVFLGGFANTALVDGLPPDSDLWLRDQNGQILRKHDGKGLIDFVKPEFQSLMVKRAIAFARCGVYDGIMLDEFADNGTGFSGRHLYPYTDEEIIEAYTNVFQSIRSQVRKDFLIIINANETKPTHYAEFINGTMMETGKDHPGGYSRLLLMKLENTLSWNEQNLREPRINCLEGEGMSIEPPDGPNNLRWMRLFTTLTLTHSDGYVLYTDGKRDLGGADHEHLWHSFWDADLGRPIGSKAQQHENINGLFIREFTNGWAVYNRSGKEQPITLPRLSTGFSSNKQDITHLLPDLDGEIYLRVGKPFDLNRDGTVNVLDLIVASQHIGTTEGDINGDGITNILDLTLVASHFSQ